MSLEGGFTATPELGRCVQRLACKKLWSILEIIKQTLIFFKKFDQIFCTQLRTFLVRGWWISCQGKGMYAGGPVRSHCDQQCDIGFLVCWCSYTLYFKQILSSRFNMFYSFDSYVMYSLWRFSLWAWLLQYSVSTMCILYSVLWITVTYTQLWKSDNYPFRPLVRNWQWTLYVLDLYCILKKVAIVILNPK